MPTATAIPATAIPATPMPTATPIPAATAIPATPMPAATSLPVVVASQAATTTSATASSGAAYGFTNGVPTQPAALATTGSTNGVPIGAALSLLGLGLLLMSAVWRKLLQQS